MKRVLILCALVALAFADDKYTDKYDYINVDEILDNDRLFNGYADCIMERGPCTPEGTELKAHMKDAIETTCSKCTKKQEDTVAKVIKLLLEKNKKLWNELIAKYDPTGKWRNEYKARAKSEYGIDLPAK